MKTSKTHRPILTIAALLVTITGGLLWWKSTHRPPKMVYTSQGFGGFTPAEKPSAKKDLLEPAEKAYNAGRFKDAEVEAERIIDSSAKSSDPVLRKKAVEARNILAFSAARRKDLKLARERFAVLEAEASKLPDKVKPEVELGQIEPNLAEQGAYQHAVCTAALGDKKAAQAEYIKFIHDYPETPLMNGVVMRLQRLNGGNLPPEAERAWKEAHKVAEQRAKERRREESMCGPECLAELLRRRGEKPDIHALAKEMKTTDRGTSLQGLADCARKHGYTPEGLSLTRRGLLKQPLPLIALTANHYVIVENASFVDVRIWDPDGQSHGKPSTRTYSWKEWSQLWAGAALVLHSR